mmetsp:Transcript_28261/g.51153  ORF Transcript_28261/g.51153 Transcript_28261/m.51153 type:complete len:89 (-) Transcript_28261:592-858(-)
MNAQRSIALTASTIVVETLVPTAKRLYASSVSTMDRIASCRIARDVAMIFVKVAATSRFVPCVLIPCATNVSRSTTWTAWEISSVKNA